MNQPPNKSVPIHVGAPARSPDPPPWPQCLGGSAARPDLVVQPAQSPWSKDDREDDRGVTCPGTQDPPPGPSTPSQAPPEAAESAEAQHVPGAPTAQQGSSAGTSVVQEDQVGSPPPRTSLALHPHLQWLLSPAETPGPSPISHTTWWMSLGGQSRCWGLPAWEQGDNPPDSRSSVRPGITHIHVWGVVGLYGRVSVFQGLGQGEKVFRKNVQGVGNLLGFSEVSQGPVSVLGVSKGPRGTAAGVVTG